MRRSRRAEVPHVTLHVADSGHCRRRSRGRWRLAIVSCAGLLIGVSRAELPQRAADELARLERSFQELGRRLAPSVVSLRVERRAGGAAVPEVVVVNGTGSIIDSSGAILTNDHVVANAATIEVRFFDGRCLPGRVTAADARSDLAIVRTTRSDLSPVTFVDWPDVQRGQWAIVLGNPFGLGQDGEWSISAGLISNLDRRLPGLGERDDRLYPDMIQTTAAINPGNSGGPLFNLRGEMVGVVTAMHTRTGIDDGAGFAIPLSPARRQRICELLAGEPIDHAWLGARVRLPTASETAADAVGTPPGVIVDQVELDGPAAAAGLSCGDRLLKLDAEPISGPADLAQRLSRLHTGSLIRLVRRRGQREEVVIVRLDRRETWRVGWLRDGVITWRGLRLVELPVHEDQRRSAGARVCVLEVLGDHRGAQQFAHAVGDVIESVDGRPVSDAQTFLREVRDRPQEIRLVLKRGGEIRVPP